MAAARFIGLLTALSVMAGTAALRAEENIVKTARDAARELEEAAIKLVVAKGEKDRIAALTYTIQAFETALSSLRASLRKVASAQKDIKTRLDLREENISRLIGVLYSIDNEPAPAKLVHPDGPLTTARAGMLLSDVLPRLQRPVEQLKKDLEDLKTLETLQTESSVVLENGLRELQSARSDLVAAASSREELPRRFIEDPAKTAILIAASESIETFIKGLSIFGLDDLAHPLPDIAEKKGTLAFPVHGRVLRGFNENDAAGIKRPGIVVATTSAAIVTTPAAVTIRYQGDLLDYGLVSILEPQRGVLFVFSGLEKTFGKIGEVLPEGSPVGIMGGKPLSAQKILQESVVTGGTYRPETLYVEVRVNEKPQDPLEWFAVKEDEG
ncbi:MAG: murein hydrolase activator EnvC family protein [Paracoccaceae bacterium]|jgi:septal ring factor EnvC (AmiA/AmiB activator)